MSKPYILRAEIGVRRTAWVRPALHYARGPQAWIERKLKATHEFNMVNTILASIWQQQQESSIK